jgi:hypothetical protein
MDDNDNPLKAAIKGLGGSMKDWTVLSAERDPLRLDTPANHTLGRWVWEHKRRLLDTASIHCRGLHYVFFTDQVIKPNGEVYGANPYDDWIWLSEKAVKAARWLEYIDFEEIDDRRNAEPELQLWTPQGYVEISAAIEDKFEVPQTVVPQLFINEQLRGEQPFHIVFIGEKSSLWTVLNPLAQQYQADLYLPTGEISDTRLYDIAVNGRNDGRPMIILYFADSDPSGHQMCLSATRKLQALGLMGELPVNVMVKRAALTPRQVTELRLPNGEPLPQSPLSPEEQRGDDWFESFGVRQTEIDALATLQPGMLTTIVNEAVAPFFDPTLNGRVLAVQNAWFRDVQQALDEHLDDVDFTDLDARLDEIRVEIPRLAAEAAQRANLDDLEVPEQPELPETEIDSIDTDDLLYDSDWTLRKQTLWMRMSKAYLLDRPDRQGSGRSSLKWLKYLDPEGDELADVITNALELQGARRTERNAAEKSAKKLGDAALQIKHIEAKNRVRELEKERKELDRKAFLVFGELLAALKPAVGDDDGDDDQEDEE